MRRRVLGAAAAALVALAAGAPAASATFGGRNGPIAFTQFETDRQNDDFSSLAVLVPAGRPRPLAVCQATSVECPSSPAFSRDGTRVAYDTGFFAPTGTHLAVAATDGSGAVPLARLTESDTDPAWSPDGKRLVFTGRTANGRHIDLFTVRSDGTRLRRLTRSGGFDPTWSSRNRIAYVRGSSIRVMRADGSHGRTIANGFHPDWSPSGRSLAYDLRGRVYTVPARARARRRLVLRRAEKPAWSPDGRRIALLRPPGDVPSDLYVVRRDGRGLRRIYRTKARADTSFSSVLDVAWGRRVP